MFSTDWDIDAHKSTHESDEHWELRKKFMLAHKSTLPEDELVCMAQVFTNIEFLGCRYPTETMQRVAELAKGVVEEFREKKKDCLKRTFVAASDAASSKVKGSSNMTKKKKEEEQPKKMAFIPQNDVTDNNFYGANKNKPNNYSDNESHEDRFINHCWPSQLSKPDGQLGKFILVLTRDRNPHETLTTTATRNNFTIRPEFVTEDSGETRCDLLIDEEIVSSATALTQSAARALAYKQLLEKFQNECYTILTENNVGREEVDHECLNAFSSMGSVGGKEKPPPDNVAMKMMRLMGWRGGGLGRDAQGILDPIKATATSHRRGFGTSEELSSADANMGCVSSDFRKKLITFLNKWIARGGATDLIFSSNFSKEERKIAHTVAHKFQLRSKSYGNGDQRKLCISKKFELWETLHNLAESKGECGKYVLLKPGQPLPPCE